MHFIDKNYIQKTGYELNLHKPFPLGYPVLRLKGKGSFQISPHVGTYFYLQVSTKSQKRWRVVRLYT